MSNISLIEDKLIGYYDMICFMLLVSIIITTKNEQKNIGRLLDSINAQSYKNIETILVDNNSSDQTKDVAKKLGAKVYNFGPERSAQRNFGAKVARGKYLLFVDADMELSKDVVLQCVKLMEKNEETVALAIPENPIASTFWDKVKAHERLIYNREGDPVTDAARFFRKEIFMRVGGYDETITGPEDWDLPETIKEAGFKIGRISGYINHRERVLSPLTLARKKFYYGLGAHRYLEKHKIPIVGPKTVYFLRPIFYKNWLKLIKNPFLTLAMIFMMTAELLGGGLGYLIGLYNSRRIKRL